jgi:gas vesicle protein
MARDDQHYMEVTFAFLLGGIVGATLALLYAPASGEQTRRRIREAGTEMGENVREEYGKMRDKAEIEFSRMKDRASEKIQSVKGAYEEKKSRFKEAYMEGKASFEADQAAKEELPEPATSDKA